MAPLENKAVGFNLAAFSFIWDWFWSYFVTKCPLIRLYCMREFTRALEECRDRLYVLVRNIVGDSVLAEDIVQDAVLAGLQALADGGRIRNVDAWLMKVARNKALDAVRSVGYRRNEPLETAVRKENGETPERIVDISGRIGMVRKATEEMPELQRTVFVLRDVLGYEFSEIAVIVGCGEANVRQLLSRARKHIREYLLNNI